MTRRCGYVAIVGVPNAGKSTLLNALVGSKVAIVTPKAQTTRTRILGLAIEGESQIILVDTPGIFAPKRRLDRAMVRAAWTGAEEADLVLLVVDSRAGLDEEVEKVIEGLKRGGRRLWLALNKVDTIDKPKLLELATVFNRAAPFEEIFMIAALTGYGVADVKAKLAAAVPEGPWLYPEDQLTDISERLLAAEITREQVFLKLHQELPYASTVETDAWKVGKRQDVRIDQTIYVTRESHKPIVLGKSGRTIKAIGAAARAELERVLDRRVHLFLHVKVREGWQDDPERYRAIGLDFEK